MTAIFSRIFSTRFSTCWWRFNIFTIISRFLFLKNSRLSLFHKTFAAAIWLLYEHYFTKIGRFRRSARRKVRNRKAVWQPYRRRPVSRYVHFCGEIRTIFWASAVPRRCVVLTHCVNEVLIGSDMQMPYGSCTIVARKHDFNTPFHFGCCGRVAIFGERV